MSFLLCCRSQCLEYCAVLNLTQDSFNLQMLVKKLELQYLRQPDNRNIPAPSSQFFHRTQYSFVCTRLVSDALKCYRCNPCKTPFEVAGVSQIDCAGSCMKMIESSTSMTFVYQYTIFINHFIKSNTEPLHSISFPFRAKRCVLSGLGLSSGCDTTHLSRI